jgi:hypothetical protein
MSTTMTPMITRVKPELRAQVQEYRRQQEEIPPLGEALRDLIELGLKAAKAAKARREQKTTTT